METIIFAFTFVFLFVGAMIWWVTRDVAQVPVTAPVATTKKLDTDVEVSKKPTAQEIARRKAMLIPPEVLYAAMRPINTKRW